MKKLAITIIMILMLAAVALIVSSKINISNAEGSLIGSVEEKDALDKTEEYNHGNTEQNEPKDSYEDGTSNSENIIIVKTDMAIFEELITNYNNIMSTLLKDSSLPLEYIRSIIRSDVFYLETVEKVVELRNKGESIDIDDITIIESYQRQQDDGIYYVKVSQLESGISNIYEYKIIYTDSEIGILGIEKQ